MCTRQKAKISLTFLAEVSKLYLLPVRTELSVTGLVLLLSSQPDMNWTREHRRHKLRISVYYFLLYFLLFLANHLFVKVPVALELFQKDTPCNLTYS